MAAISKQRAFLKAFRITASITKAAEAAKVDRAMHYRWLRELKYSVEFEAAQVEAAHFLEDEAVRRSTEGVVEAVFYRGKPCGVIRRYSDGMLQFLLRGFMPEKYRERTSTELTGPGGTPLTPVKINVNFVNEPVK